MKILSLEQIKSVDDTAAVELPVPEWGEDCGVYVRGMKGSERAEFEEMVQKNLSMKHMKIDLVIKCTVDEDGDRMFSTKDKTWLLDKSSMAIETIFNKIFELSGLDAEADKNAEGN